MKQGMTFHDRAKLAGELLAKQEPVTLEEARAQVIWLKVRSSNAHKEEEIRHLLKMYRPKWNKKQIDVEFNRIINVKSKEDCFVRR